MSDWLNSSIKWIYSIIPIPSTSSSKQVERVVIKEITEIMPQSGRLFVRLAGISGALAVALGAYGAHVLREEKIPDERKIAFESGNRYHFYHTLALLMVPMTRRPKLVGSLMCLGILLFSGSCYYHALTGDTSIRRVTPFGGMLFIAAWISVVL